MKIQEFIKDRNVSYDTVRQYIRRNADQFHGHIGRNNSIVLDEIAVQLLNQKYPRLAAPVQVIQDNAAREKLQELQEKYIVLLEENNRLTQENANLMLMQHKQLLLEEENIALKGRADQLEVSVKERLMEEARVIRSEKEHGKSRYRLEKILESEDSDVSDQSWEQVFNQYKQLIHERDQEYDQEIAVLRQQLDQEKSKTWWDKLRGR